MEKLKKYKQIYEFVKKKIQSGTYPEDHYIPSENELCSKFSTTRTTVRKALEELLKEGFIEKEQGKGSKVIRRSKSIGLLTVRGFSGSTPDYEVLTKITKEPKISKWDPVIIFPLSEEEKKSDSIYFQRVRYINNKPIVLENNWYSQHALELIKSEDFVDGSFFKTLSQNHYIEIIGSEQELRSIAATKEVAKNLDTPVGDPILQISIRFKTSRSDLFLYSILYCNTSEYPIRNSYFL
ncbi:GntR family transcriptional regulator [Tamlana sp. I1]|uniref:GntR family transcriptional regulator n=1 Tax=Tamlana sp. I1 TaxID=2762061 RepID=UPI00189051CE|nr:GntR family transcriptional regulator [Tamlana sp. I1]